MSDSSDNALMQAFCDGDAAAFQVLFTRYQDRLYRFIYGMYAPDATHAEDWVQEVFLRVIRARDSYDPARPFAGWLFVVARHYCLNQLRAPVWNLEISGDDLEERSTAAPQPDAGTALATAELHQRVHEAIAALPAYLREVFVLREIEDMHFGEMATLLGRSEGTLRTQLHRARAHLQRLLKPYLEDNDEE